MCHDSEYGRILNMHELFTHGSKYTTIWLNMSEKDVNMPEFTIIVRALNVSYMKQC